MALAAGWCPVCSVTGRLLFLKALHGGQVFIGCNMCEAGWVLPAPVTNWDNSIIDYAPKGFRAATQAEVSAAGQDMRIVETVSDSEMDLFK